MNRHLIASLLFLCFIVAQAIVPADLITILPNLSGPLPSAQYSGYLSFKDPAGSNTIIHYHYWLSLSENKNPYADPLIYWSNGGPGCSSLEGTFFEGGKDAYMLQM